MKHSYIIVPVLLTLCFAGYASWSAKEKEESVARAQAQAMQARRAAIEAMDSGAEFVGRDGKREAEADILRGVPKLLLYGKTRADIAERSALFKQRFGLTIDPLAGCLVSEPLVAFATAYNAVIQNYLAAKFGPTAFEEADREAMKTWEAKRNERG